MRPQLGLDESPYALAKLLVLVYEWRQRAARRGRGRGSTRYLVGPGADQEPAVVAAPTPTGTSSAAKNSSPRLTTSWGTSSAMKCPDSSTSSIRN